jgi:serine/threonine-protein kinase
MVLSALLVAGACAQATPLPRMHPASPWYQRIDQPGTVVHTNSASMISTWFGLGGFGNTRMQIDFGFMVLYAPAGTETANIVELPSVDPNDDYYLPDCEPLNSLVPLPVGGAIEANAGYTCDNFGEDCHLLVVQGQNLFEVYRANRVGNTLEAQCLALWRLDALYPDTGRGEHCTSADAAGFPIAPLLFNADEVAAALAPGGSGDVGHAIRFILPNARMANDPSLGGSGGRLYVRPATHAGNPQGPVGSVPYGVRLRLRSDFPMDNYNAAAQVILRTMQRYGIVLSDGGNIALTAENDRYTTAKWDDPGINIGSRVFDSTAGATKVLATDFAVIDTGSRIGETFDCVRSQPSTDGMFANGFE